MNEYHNISKQDKGYCEQIYKNVVNYLEYEANPYYRVDNMGVYDACFYITVEQKEYPIVGIKKIYSSREEDIAKQHLFYWNRNDVPISILICPNEYRIYNNFSCRKGKSLLSKGRSINEIMACEILDDLKASHIVTKMVWERLLELSNPGDRVDKQLLVNLKNAVFQACNEYDMELENAYNFMSQCIFIKYLEDRCMLTKNAFKNWNVKSYTELLEKQNANEIYEFFVFLKDRFNGDLFSIKKENIPSNEQLIVFYNFFKGDDFGEFGYSQMRLFPYDFSVIPISLISNIYETFFSMGDEWKTKKKAAGAFYTPHYLADYMVQQCFAKWKKSNEIPSVIDPACGSGVFLVSAFKCQIEMKKKKNDILTAEELSKLMTEMIWGVDINEGALNISCFSLYIALLDELTPKDIIENQFHFPNLIGKNLIKGSFFSKEIEEKMCGKVFDIVVGNPPWKSIPQSDHVIYCKERNVPIADAQIAQAFISRVSDFVDESAVISLLVTNAIFTNKNSKKYLKYLLSEYLIEQVMNFESIKAQLFIHATYPCSIITYRCKKVPNYNIIYYAFKPNLLFRLLNQFIYDKQEEIKIKKNKIENNTYLWTLLTYGDAFDIECIEKIKCFPELAVSIEKKINFVQGYITAKEGERCEDFVGYKGGSLKGCFKPYSIDYENLPLLSQDLLFDRTRKISIYTCPNKVLVKRTYNEQCWGAAYVKEPVVFSNDFSTFNDESGTNIELLRYIEGVLNSKVFRYYCFYMTKVKAAKKPEVVKEDILHFPMPLFKAENEEVQNFIELVIKMETIVSGEYKTGLFNESKKEEIQEKLDKLVYRFYELDEFHISVIEDGLNRFNKEKNDFAEIEDYQIYAQYLCDYFDYFMNQNDKDMWKSQIIEGEFYTKIKFSFGSEEMVTNKTIDLLGLLGVQKINAQLLVQNRIFIYDETGFSVIQTKEKSNWTINRARKMAAQITREIMNAGGDKNDK